ncbi:MAG: MarR family transcriptional regulator [Intrasporangium sp.]|uniref:MarR family winged helix-turn-helix transcriptional regulator n=1 Tax=Intrasporangium sp. TaxID=1925024 RepID=UPI0026478BCA|nr:MarR family transcriptional regulator [Intrasporangium sp.]MDN5798213.1 MarR family transcriptional regulator [Intrasporangium sp.]
MADAVPQWRPSPTLAALQELIDVAQALPETVARRAGLSVTELHSLRALSERAMGPVELARHLRVTSAASSGVVDRLVARGHAQRKPHPIDGRRTQVVITDSGRREVIAQLRPMFEGLATVDTTLTDVEREVVGRYLDGVLEAMRRLL